MSTKCPACQKSVEVPSTHLSGGYLQCKDCHSMFLYPMPSNQDMQAYAEKNYKEGGLYAEYVKAKELKVYTFRQRLNQFKKFLADKKIKHLDVGCSAGFMIEVGLENGFDSYGVEFSQVAISYARKDVQARIFSMNVNELQLKDSEKFDLITCYDIIEHVKNPEEFLSSLRNLLSPQGVLVVTTPDPSHFLAKVMKSHWPMLQPLQHTILFSPKIFGQVLETSGFKELGNRAAYKAITIQYMAGQLKEGHPFLAALLRALCSILPKSIANRPLHLNISEFLSIAQKAKA